MSVLKIAHTEIDRPCTPSMITTFNCRLLSPVDAWPSARSRKSVSLLRLRRSDSSRHGSVDNNTGHTDDWAIRSPGGVSTTAEFVPIIARRALLDVCGGFGGLGLVSRRYHQSSSFSVFRRKKMMHVLTIGQTPNIMDCLHTGKRV